MSPDTALTPAGRGRLRAFYLTLLNLSNAMSAKTYTPEEVLKRFAKILKTSGPFLHTAVTIVTPWALLITAITEHQWVLQTCNAAKDRLMGLVAASVNIDDSHFMHTQLLKWMAENGLGYEVRTLSLTLPDWADYHADEEIESSWVRRPLKYRPSVGTYTHVFEGHRLTIRRIIVQRERARDDIDAIRISCLSPLSGPRVIKRFLDHIQTALVTSHKGKTTIYRPQRQGWSWDGGVTRPSRNLKAVTLDSAVKDPLVQDIDAYLNPRTRKYYSNRGIPWRRGFLFYGPPGTGKTSFTTALAGHFKLDVFMLSLSSASLNDQKLESLFSKLTTKCMVLLEDIDSAGIRREDMSVANRPKKKKGKDEKGDEVEEEQRVTLGGLLNVLDGIHSVEGRIIIMSTNNPDSLDEALIRRGRIDQRILFGYATREVSAEIFRHVFCKSEDELLENEEPRDHNVIEQLARQFASNFPAETLTPAEVQGFLLDERKNPERAVEMIADHAEGILKNKARGANVANFAGASGEKDVAVESSTAATIGLGWLQWFGKAK